MRLVILSFILLFSGCSIVVKNETPSAKPNRKTASVNPTQLAFCEAPNETRILKLTKEGKSCDLIYTRNGVEKSIANAKHNPDFCATKIPPMIKKFTDAGFLCSSYIETNEVYDF